MRIFDIKCKKALKYSWKNGSTIWIVTGDGFRWFEKIPKETDENYQEKIKKYTYYANFTELYDALKPFIENNEYTVHTPIE